VNTQTNGALTCMIEDPEQIIPAAFGQPDSISSSKDSIYCLYYKYSYFKYSYKPEYKVTYLIKDSNFKVIVDPKTDFKIGDPAKKLIKHFKNSNNQTGDSIRVYFSYKQNKELIKDKSCLIFYLSNNKISSILCEF